jgi:hypothetical protein
LALLAISTVDPGIKFRTAILFDLESGAVGWRVVGCQVSLVVIVAVYHIQRCRQPVPGFALLTKARNSFSKMEFDLEHFCQASVHPAPFSGVNM